MALIKYLIMLETWKKRVCDYIFMPCAKLPAGNKQPPFDTAEWTWAAKREATWCTQPHYESVITWMKKSAPRKRRTGVEDKKKERSESQGKHVFSKAAVKGIDEARATHPLLSLSTLPNDLIILEEKKFFSPALDSWVIL